MDTNKEEDKKPSSLLNQIYSCKNDRLLSITKTHVCTLLKYTKDVYEKGSAAFASKAEYQEFIIAKFYVDKCLGALRTNKANIEPEIDSDASDEISDLLVEAVEEIPPLEAFHLSHKERLKRLYNFWRNVKEGYVYHAKVVEVTDDTYDLVLVNQYMKDERLIDTNISGCMKKSSCEENLSVSDLVRVSALSCTTANSLIKLIVTAKKAELKVKLENIELGKISKEDLPFPAIETYKYISLTQYIAAHCTDRNPVVLLNKMKALEIDPYKTYSFLPELDGKKAKKKEQKRSKEALKEDLAINAIREALMWKEKKDVEKAMDCVDTALKMFPKYDLAYAVRGTLFEMKALEQKAYRFLRNAAEDYFSALRLNSNCQLASSQVSQLLLRSAAMYLEDGAFDKARENLQQSLQLQANEQAESLMQELNRYKEKWQDVVAS